MGQCTARMTSATLRQRVSDGSIVVNGWCHLPSAEAAEVMAMQGWDTVCVDLQHGMVGYQRALSLIRAIEGRGVTSMARIPWIDPAVSMKLLDAGVGGLICPMISAPEDAERFVGFCRYPPKGIRSFGPTRAGLVRKDYADVANDEIICAVQIEDRAAVDALDEIAAVPGIDMLYVGPADLSLSLGHRPALDQDLPELIAIYERLIDTCARHDVVAAIHCGSAAYAGRMARMGFGFVTVSSDLRLMAAAASQTLADTRRGAAQGNATLVAD